MASGGDLVRRSLPYSAFPAASSIPQRHIPSSVCNSLSKNCGMSGWRIGYLVTNPVLLFEILKINHHPMGRD